MTRSASAILKTQARAVGASGMNQATAAPSTLWRGQGRVSCLESLSHDLEREDGDGGGRSQGRCKVPLVGDLQAQIGLIDERARDATLLPADNQEERSGQVRPVRTAAGS